MAAKGPITPRELEKSIKSGALAPVYFLHGAEERGIAASVKTIRAEVIKNADPSTAWRAYDLSEEPFSSFLQDVMTVSFFSERRGVLLGGLLKRGAKTMSGRDDGEDEDEDKNDKGLRLSEPEQKALLDYCANPSSDVVLVIAPGKIDARLKFWKELSGKAVTVTFSPNDTEKRALIIQTLAESGLTFTPDAREWMATAFTPNFSLLESEMAKLSLYMGDNKRVTQADLETCMAVPSSDNIFMLVDAIVARNADGMLHALGSLKSQGAILVIVLAMIARQFRLLLIIRSMKDGKKSEAEIMTRCGIKLSYIYNNKYLPHIKSTSAARLKRVVVTLSEIDIRIKSSGLNEWMVLEQELIALVSGASRQNV